MSIDTGKKKDLSSPQTIAQWFALNLDRFLFPKKVNPSPVTETAFLKLISIDLEFLRNGTDLGKEQYFCVDVNMTRMEASL